MSNIVFDLGGVVVTWEPEAIITKVFSEPRLQARVRSGVFGHGDWLELDRGTLPLRNAIARAAARTGLPESEIERLFREVPPSLVPIPGTVDLLHRLKAKGHRLYVLSNMHVASIEHLEGSCSFWDLFAGRVISCRVHLIKPEPEIYTYLLKGFGLDEAETVFIDDTEVNLVAASLLGIRAIRFENPMQCGLQLEALGCL